MTVKVDRKGRIVIPSNIRKTIGMGNIVSIEVEEGRVTLKPVEDPSASLQRLVVKGTKDVEMEIRRLREAAERRLLEET